MLLSAAAFAQTSSAPGSPQQPGRQVDQAPQPQGAPPVSLPAAKPAYVASNVKVRPAAFKVSGATLFTESQLVSQVAEFLGKELDFNGLADVAAKLKRFYVDAGYPLTDVYFPEQRFAAQGGTVEFAVVEARLGRVSVVVAPNARVRPEFIKGLVEAHLQSGQFVTQGGLDRPILLLRDLPGTTATAEVTPGSAVGLADVTVKVAPQGTGRADWSLGLDNFGSKDIGEYRATASGSVENTFGYGDVLAASIQPTERSGTALYRVGLRSSIGPWGSKASLSLSQSNYVLGGAFAGLDASGDARIASLGLIHPVMRARASNLFVLLGADTKRLRDEAGAVVERKVDVQKAGLLGNHASGGLGLGATTSFSLTFSGGKLDIRDPGSLAQDGLNTGPRTQGSFTKASYELQRVEFLTEATTLSATVSGQTASKNLTSAEKLSLTGPAAVRGYVADSGSVVDEGSVVTLELRRRLAWAPGGAAVHLSVFYDYGTGVLDKVRNATTNSNLVGLANRVTVDSWGVGATVGIEGNFFFSASVAQRLGGPVFTGSADSKSRFWFSLVKTF